MSGATAQHRDQRAWLAERATGIGGSDVAALFGMHPFKTAREVWLEKTGRGPQREETPDMRRGRRLEDIAAVVYTERTHRRLRRQPLRRHPDYPMILCSIDRQIIAGEWEDLRWETGPCELKVPRTRTFYRWKREGLPDYINLQGQHEAFVWGYSYTGFGIYGPDDDAMLHFDVPADDRVSARIAEFVPEWWEKYVVRDVEPPEDAAVPTIKLPDVEGTITKREDRRFALLCAEYHEARELEKEARELKEAAARRLIMLIDGKHGAYEHASEPFRVYYSASPGRIQPSQTLKVVQARKPVDPVKLAAELHERGVDLHLIESAIQESYLDFAALEQRGAPSESLRVFRLKREEE